MAGVDDLARVEIRARADLRNWLQTHHSQPESVWLVTWKKHTAHYVSMGEIIEELLCFGWVDSRVRSVDSDRTSVLIAPRNPESAWSRANKQKVGRLRAAGLMTPAGEALVKAAQANGMWTFLDDVEALIVPDDLHRALFEIGAADAWEASPEHVKKGILEWIKRAKRPQTRARRIEESARSLAAGGKPRIFG